MFQFSNSILLGCVRTIELMCNTIVFKASVKIMRDVFTITIQMKEFNNGVELA